MGVVAQGVSQSPPSRGPGLGLRQSFRYGASQAREMIFDDPPDDAIVDRGVPVNENVSESDDLRAVRDRRCDLRVISRQP